MSETLDEARARLRRRMGAGARYDDAAAPAEALATMRLARADCQRELYRLSDAALEHPAIAQRIAELGCVARLVAETFETVSGFSGIEGDTADRNELIEAEVALAATLPGRALRSLYLHALQHLDVACRDLGAEGWARTFAAPHFAATPPDCLARVADLLAGAALTLKNFADHDPVHSPPIGAVMTDRLFTSPAYPSVAIEGRSALFPVHRIFCVGRNYAEHAKEMGVEVDREAPFYFLKDAQALVGSGDTVPYPPGTSNYHYEMELVIAIGTPAFQADADAAAQAIFGYAAGLDMTRRDLQLAARAKQRPWDLGKNFERSAVMAPIVEAAAFDNIGPRRITLHVNGEVKQDAHLSDLVWSPIDLVTHLSGFYHLQPGDLIYTGTPAGVGPVVAGDEIVGRIDGLPDVRLTIGTAE